MVGRLVSLGMAYFQGEVVWQNGRLTKVEQLEWIALPETNSKHP